MPFGVGVLSKSPKQEKAYVGMSNHRHSSHCMVVHVYSGDGLHWIPVLFVKISLPISQGLTSLLI